jgi:hypothetical protein
VLPLTALLGRRAVAPGEVPSGRVRDLVVRLGAEHPRVERVLLDRDRQAVAGTTDERVLHVGEAGPRMPLAADELLLRRDVLDTQVVDVDGYRVSRVGDVWLAEADDGGLEVVAVEVAARPVLRRLGLSRSSTHAREQALDWATLHLTSARGHQVQLGSRAAVAQRLDAAGLAALVSRLAPAHAAAVVGSVDPEVAAAAVDRLRPHTGSRVLAAMTPTDADRALRHAGPETRAAYRALHEGPRRGRRLRRLEGWRSHRSDHRVGGRGTPR